MPYTQPTPTTFKARFPEFTPVSDTLINLVLAEAIPQVGDTWLERDRARAQMLLTAHTLTLEGEPSRTETGDATGLNGAVKRSKVGDVETEFAGIGGSSHATGLSGYSATIYGQQFASLLRKNFHGVGVV